MSQTTVLHENVLKLLPTLDALAFAVDSSGTIHMKRFQRGLGAFIKYVHI